MWDVGRWIVDGGRVCMVLYVGCLKFVGCLGNWMMDVGRWTGWRMVDGGWSKFDGGRLMLEVGMWIVGGDCGMVEGGGWMLEGGWWVAHDWFWRLAVGSGAVDAGRWMADARC